MFALRRSAAMQRYSLLNSSMAVERVGQPAIVEFKPPPAISNNGKPEPTLW